MGADKLWAAYRLKESYKKLLAATEEMVKSQFIEMFYNEKYPLKKLKTHIDVIRGVSYKPVDIKEAVSDSSSVILRSNNIANGQINFDNVVCVDNKRVTMEQVLSKGDIVMCGSNGSKKLVGKAAMINEIPSYRTSFGAFCVGIRCKESILPKYLSVYFQTSKYRDVIEFLGSGSNILNIKPEHIYNLEIPIPSLEDQKQFVTIAEQADKSGFDGRKSQFIEMFGNPVTNTKQWPAKPISKVAPEQPSETKTTGSVWLLNLDMIESNTGKIIEKVYEDDSKLLSVAPFDEGNVLYSKLRPYLNKVVIPDGKGYATTELVPLRPNQELVNLTFFSHLLRGDDFVSYANGIATGTKMPRMPLNDLRKFNCILPPIQMQKEFEVIAEQADKSGSVLQYRMAC